MNGLNNVTNAIEKARLLRDQGKFEEALKILDLIYENNPNSEDVKDILVETLFEYGGYLNDYYSLEYEKARQVFERITILNPKNYRAHYNLGIAFFNLGQIENAKRSFEKALKIKPDYKYCFYNLGLAYESIDKFEEALKYYEQALEIDPQFSYALAAQSQIRRKLDEMKGMKIK